MIISASRRTDIPAFYHAWFMQRVRQGFVMVRNPFNPRQIRQVSLAAQDVDGFVFWTRNGAPMLPHLAELDRQGHAYLFHYTITGYPRWLEPSVPSVDSAIAAFCRLSDHVGEDRMIWRYDPIVLGPGLDMVEHRQMFSRLARALRGKTRVVVVSFLDFHAKTRRNMQRIQGFTPWDVNHQPDLAGDLLTVLVAEAADQGMQVQTCCEVGEMEAFGVVSGACLDARHLSVAFDKSLTVRRDRGQRAGCGCIKSVDIGAYHSCLHGCVYCYATDSPQRALQNWQSHCADTPFLLPTER